MDREGARGLEEVSVGWGPGTRIPTLYTKVAAEMTPGKAVKEARS